MAWSYRDEESRVFRSPSEAAKWVCLKLALLLLCCCCCREGVQAAYLPLNLEHSMCPLGVSFLEGSW